MAHSLKRGRGAYGKGVHDDTKRGQGARGYGTAVAVGDSAIAGGDERGQGRRPHTLVYLVRQMKYRNAMPFCCTALYYGALVRCPANVDVEVIDEAELAKRDTSHSYTIQLHGNDAHTAISVPARRKHAFAGGLPHQTAGGGRGGGGGGGGGNGRVVHVIDSMEPPGYNSQMKTGDMSVMGQFDLSLGFKHAPRHISTPYVLIR